LNDSSCNTGQPGDRYANLIDHRVTYDVIDHALQGERKAIAQLLVGDLGAKEVIRQHLQHHDLDLRFECVTNQFLAATFQTQSKCVQSLPDRVAKRFFKVMKFSG